MEKSVKAIRLDKLDNVVTVIQAVSPGTVVRWSDDPEDELTAQADIPRFHKMAIADIEQGAVIRKYGNTIGAATQPIVKGTHVHTHNCAGTAVEELMS